MKNNIIKILIGVLNNRGKISSNVMAGLSVGVFAAVVGYSVYNAYNQSPAYNPAKRAIYTGEGQNLNLNSFDSSDWELDNSGTLPMGDGAGLYSSDGAFADSEYDQTQADSEEAKFREARAYLDAQKTNKAENAAQKQGQETATAKKGAAPRSAETVQNGTSKTIGSARNSYDAIKSTKVSQTGGYYAGVGENSSAVNKSKQKKSAVRQGNSYSAMLSPTAVNKLAGSGGGSSFSGGSSGSGSSSGGGTGSSYGGSSSKSVKDGQSRTLPNNNAANTDRDKVFQLGRDGTIGGFQAGVGAEGGESTGKGGERGNAKDQLNTAYSFSTKGAATIQAGGEKALAQGAVEAANAFDGGAKVESGAIIGDGPTMDIGSHNLGFNMGKSSLGLNNIQTEFESRAEKKERLFNSAGSHLLWALVSTIVAVIAISVILKTKDVYTYIAAIVLALGAMYAIWLADYDGDGLNIFQTLSELGKLRQEDGQSNNAWLYYSALGLMSAGVIASLIWGSDLISKLPSTVSKFLGKIFTPLAANQVRKAATGVINSNNDKTEA